MKPRKGVTTWDQSTINKKIIWPALESGNPITSYLKPNSQERESLSVSEVTYRECDKESYEFMLFKPVDV
jgi:hypothetical protein